MRWAREDAAPWGRMAVVVSYWDGVAEGKGKGGEVVEDEVDQG